jgi:hypothetical protein
MPIDYDSQEFADHGTAWALVRQLGDGLDGLAGKERTDYMQMIASCIELGLPKYREWFPMDCERWPILAPLPKEATHAD